MSQETITLSGRELTTAQVARIARQYARVEISAQAEADISATRKLILEMAKDRELPRIYGFNTGVGMNKDWDISEEGLGRFNRMLINSHSAAVGPEASEEEVRAMLAVRLNCFLTNHTGASPELIHMYRDFLNLRLHPVMPTRGSIGESDLVVMAHIGLAVQGEGEVFLQGERMSAAEALAKAGLKPVTLGCKDGLAIVNTSALFAGLGSLLAEDVMEFMDMCDLLYALSLEAFGGNTSPLDEACHLARPVRGPMETAARVRRYLEGRFIWQPGVTVTMQDPLCYRSACHVNGAVRDALDYVIPHLAGHINSSDDNPCVVSEQRRILSCSNYDATSLALGFEMLGQALCHVSRNICYQLIKLDTPYFSRLPRFLSPDGTSVMAYTTNQKTYTALDAENRLLSNPVNVDWLSVSGDVEDHATNAPLIVAKTSKMLDNLRYMLGMQAYHAAQAIDLRNMAPLGRYTSEAYAAIRDVIPFVDQDRVVSIDIRRAYELVRSGRLCAIARR